MIRWGTVQWSRDTVAIERYTTTTLCTHTVRISMRPHQQNSYLVSEIYVNHSHTIISWVCKYNTYTTVLKFGVGKIFKCFWKKSQMPHKAIFIWPKKSLLLLLSENTIVNIITILLFGSLPQPTGPVPATFQSSTSVPVDSLILNKDAKCFPSWWTTSPPPDLLDTSTQVCLLD